MFKIPFIAYVIVAVLAAFSYQQYKISNLEADLVIRKSNEETLKNAVFEQGNTIIALQNVMGAAIDNLNRLNKAVHNSRTVSAENNVRLNNKRGQLAKTAMAKPLLVQNAINEATQDLFTTFNTVTAQ